MAVVIYNRIEQIKELWKELFEENSDLTFFQSYEWNECLERRFQRLHLIKYPHFHLEYAVLCNSIIAPLIINEKEKKVFILGHDEMSDYLSFVYRDNEIEELDEHIYEIVSYYQGYSIQLSKINESFKMKRAIEHLISCHNICLETHTTACVFIPMSFEDSLYTSMSKSKKQNYRTSLNRLKKDGKSYKIETHYGPIKKPLELELYRLYFQRRNECDEKKPGLYSRLRYRYGLSKYGNQYDVLSCYASDNPVYLAMIHIEGKLAAFCEGAYSNNRKRLCISRVAINSEYAKYSPGIIMLVDIINKQKSRLDYFDLTRGQESYKYDLGGILHRNYSYTIMI